MKKVVLTILPILLLAASSFAQSVKPTPKPTPPDDDVVKISTKLVQVDVSVTDKNGKIVRDLRPDEIEIYQNGKKQDITNFSFISNAREVVEERKPKPEPQSQTRVTLPPAPVKAENVKRTIALVASGLSFQSTYYARRALKKFVDDQMQDGDLVAIIGTGGGSGVLQQFTTDKRLLYAAIEDMGRYSIVTGMILPFDPIRPSADTGIKPKPGERTQEDRDREIDDFRDGNNVKGDLRSLNQIIRGMRDLPGRKSVMLLSDGFALTTFGIGGLTDFSVYENVRRVVDSANRASVVINTMDTRGLVDTSFTAAEDLTGSNGATLSGDQMLKAIVGRNLKVVDTQQGPATLARQTGGISIINNNDLSGGIRRILDDQSYYLVGYQPDDETFDPKTRPFNKLEVKVKRKGLGVRYRSGFFGFSDDEIQKPQMTGGQRFVSALLSPFAANDISIRLNAIFNNDAKQGSYIRSLLHIKAQDLKFTDEPDGSKKAVFDILASGIDYEGNSIDQVNKSYTLTADKALYDKFLRSGFVYNFTFPVKQAGVYQLRVALRDRATEKIGSANQLVEVPEINNKRLTLSGIYLESSSPDEWNKRNTMPTTSVGTDPQSDTSLRRFKRGTVLSYAFVVFNARLDAADNPKLSVQIKLFCDGKPLFDGDPISVPFDGQADLQRIGAGGSLNLGAGMQAGDYILQIIVKDALAKEKQQISTQFVQFEVVE